LSINPPPFPEAALRGLLGAVAGSWLGESRAAEASAGDEPPRFYVDGFAGAEFRFGTGVARGEGCVTRASEVVAVLGLHQPPAADAPALLFADEDPAHLQRIYCSLEEQVGGERVRSGEAPPPLLAGEVALVESPFVPLAAELARRTAQGESFVWLAPPAARELPWDALLPFLRQPRTTLLLRLPHSDFLKQARHTSPLADLPGFARRMVEGCSALLGDPRHSWLASWRADAAPAEESLGRVAASLAERLRSACGERLVRPVRLSTREGACVWLFLITPHPAVALALNAAAHTHGLVQGDQEPHSVDEQPVSAEDGAPLDLFTLPPAAEAPNLASIPRRPAAGEVAGELLRRFGRHRVAWVDVLHAFAASDITLDELRRGLERLRRRGEAEYRGRLGEGAEITFGEARPDPPRRGRPSASHDLFEAAE
jgi:hypothetical protein